MFRSFDRYNFCSDVPEQSVNSSCEMIMPRPGLTKALSRLSMRWLKRNKIAVECFSYLSLNINFFLASFHGLSIEKDVGVNHFNSV